MRWTEKQVEDAEKTALGIQLARPELIGAAWLPKPSQYIVVGHTEIAQALITAGARATVHDVGDALGEAGHRELSGGIEYLVGLVDDLPDGMAMVERDAKRVIEADEDRKQARVDMLRDKLAEAEADLHRPPLPLIAKPRTLAFDQLAPHRAPPRHWFRADWLGAGVTLFPGKGGEGKSTLAQHEATCGGLGRAYFVGESPPYRSLLWNCEDEHDDVWRRQEQICDHEQLEMASLVDRLFLVSRYGCDNALMAESHGALVATRLFDELQQQVNDLAIDVLWLDNIAHLLAGDHDDRTHATQFINALNSLVVGRPFGVVLLAHVARAQGSEYTGSAAWENAARMRWFLGPRLPDQPFDIAEEVAPTDVRYLCKRKSNYSARDYAKFTMRAGLMVPEQVDGERLVGLMSAAEEARADQLCVAGFKSLQGMGIQTTDGKTSPDYLPSQIAAKSLAPGYTKADLARAMNRLMTRGVFVRREVGRYANRSPKFGLALSEEQA